MIDLLRRRAVRDSDDELHDMRINLTPPST
jgi:hypothetical protein